MFRATALVALAILAPMAARAGQVRVDAGGPLSRFVPDIVTVNPGDHVVWVSVSGGHTITSGTDGSNAGSGAFKSADIGQFGIRFAWQATGADSMPYYCVPHFLSGMRGVIRIDASGTAPIADFRITEVEFAGTGGVDRVQIANLGNAPGQLGQYRCSFANGVSYVYSADPVSLAPGARIRVSINFGGTSNQTIWYTPSGSQLGSAGSFALYVPNTSTAGQGSSEPGSLTAPTQLVDYVEWGSSGQAAQPNRTTAEAAGRWPAADVVDVTDLPNGGAGYSISFCGTRTDRGSGYWFKTRPNFGTGAVCTTPAQSASWGRIKSLYR